MQRSSYYSPAGFECKKNGKKKSHSKTGSYGKKVKKSSKSKNKDKKTQKADENKQIGKSKDKNHENFHLYCKNGVIDKKSYLI